MHKIHEMTFHLLQIMCYYTMHLYIMVLTCIIISMLFMKFLFVCGHAGRHIYSSSLQLSLLIGNLHVLFYPELVFLCM